MMKTIPNRVVSAAAFLYGLSARTAILPQLLKEIFTGLHPATRKCPCRHIMPIKLDTVYSGPSYQNQFPSSQAMITRFILTLAIGFTFVSSCRAAEAEISVRYIRNGYSKEGIAYTIGNRSVREFSAIADLWSVYLKSDGTTKNIYGGALVDNYENVYTLDNSSDYSQRKAYGEAWLATDGSYFIESGSSNRPTNYWDDLYATYFNYELIWQGSVYGATKIIWKITPKGSGGSGGSGGGTGWDQWLPEDFDFERLTDPNIEDELIRLLFSGLGAVATATKEWGPIWEEHMKSLGEALIEMKDFTTGDTPGNVFEVPEWVEKYNGAVNALAEVYSDMLSSALAPAFGMLLDETRNAMATARFTTPAGSPNRDYNGDWMPDLVMKYPGGYVGAWCADASGNLKQWVPLAGGGSFGAWDVAGSGDFNNDGIPDLALTYPGGYVGAWCPDSSGDLKQWLPLNGGSSFGRWSVAKTGEFNGDGIPDLILEYPGGYVGAWCPDAFGNLKQWVPMAKGGSFGGWSVGGVADFSGDGIPDLILEYPGGYMGAWCQDGAGNFLKWVPMAGGGSLGGWKLAGTADFSRDNIPDLVLQYPGGYLGAWCPDASGNFKQWISLGGGGSFGQWSVEN